MHYVQFSPMKGQLGIQILKDISKQYPELLIFSPLMKLDDPVLQTIIQNY
jgi:hypothetical protein